jgi:hypothetical protein
MTQSEAMRLANELDAYHTAPHHKQAAMLVRKVQMNAVTATPHAELLAELMNPNNPKNEREHAAVREIERLCEALAQPAQEPVAWRFTGIAGLNRFMTQKKYEAQAAEIKKWYEPFKCANCTTPPAAQHTWVDLTEQEALDCFDPNPVIHSKNVAAKLKEKNT